MDGKLPGSPLPYRLLGIDVEDPHIPVPESHRPNTQTIVSNGYEGIVVKEPETGAFIHCERPVEVRP